MKEEGCHDLDVYRKMSYGIVTVVSLIDKQNDEVDSIIISKKKADLKNFLADHRELVGNTELQYSYTDKCYRLYTDEFLSNKELFSLVEVMIGARAFSKMELLVLIDKLKKFMIDLRLAAFFTIQNGNGRTPKALARKTPVGAQAYH